jgi:lipoyl-dependent peroxiredoxin
MEKIYTAIASVNGGGRNGHITSSDNLLDFDVRMPKEMGGSGGATNPEQLFAAGYAACFDGALNLVARNQKVTVGETSVTANITIGKVEDGTLGLAAQLDVKVAGVDLETAKQLVHAAHQVCPYSKATRGNIEVVLNVIIA